MPRSRSVASQFAPLPLCFFLLSCFQQIEVLEKKVDALSEHQRTQDAELKRLSQQIDRQWARINCKNEKVREFLQACEAGGDSGECSAKAVDGALEFLDSQPYVTVYLRPEHPLPSLIRMRRGQLVELVKPLYLFPTTRFLIIAQPRGEGSAFDTEARRVGEEVSQYLRFDLRLPADRAVMGPLLMPCKSKSSWMSHYGGRYDHHQPGEPPKKEDRVRLWVFRCDC